MKVFFQRVVERKRGKKHPITLAEMTVIDKEGNESKQFFGYKSVVDIFNTSSGANKDEWLRAKKALEAKGVHLRQTRQQRAKSRDEVLERWGIEIEEPGSDKKLEIKLRFSRHPNTNKSKKKERTVKP